jgi:hypothetical protein
MVQPRTVGSIVSDEVTNMKWTVLLALGCTPKADESTHDGAASVVDNGNGGAPSDTGTNIDSGDDGTVEPDLTGLNGRVIDPPLAATDFSALNLDGSARDRSDLIDRRTVMWFYPAAGTYG